MDCEEECFRWGYALLVSLAKRLLVEANQVAARGDWPAGQTWDELGDSS